MFRDPAVCCVSISKVVQTACFWLEVEHAWVQCQAFHVVSSLRVVSSLCVRTCTGLRTSGKTYGNALIDSNGSASGVTSPMGGVGTGMAGSLAGMGGGEGGPMQRLPSDGDEEDWLGDSVGAHGQPGSNSAWADGIGRQASDDDGEEEAVPNLDAASADASAKGVGEFSVKARPGPIGRQMSGDDEEDVYEPPTTPFRTAIFGLSTAGAAGAGDGGGNFRVASVRRNNPLYGARFRQEFTLEDAIGSHTHLLA
jgi:hypothetical protein